MDYLFEDFFKEIKKLFIENALSSENVDALCKEYTKKAEIHCKNQRDFGCVLTNAQFARAVEHGSLTSCDGMGYYVDTKLVETNESVVFDEKIIRQNADKYPYILWYGK